MKYYDYYGALGVRYTCKAVKNKVDIELKRLAINMMVLHFAEIDIEDNSVIIPVPNHTGRAEYTKEIALSLVNFLRIKKDYKRIEVLDILRCKRHISTYECKKSGYHPEPKFYCDWSEHELDKMTYKYITHPALSDKRIYLLDNVISTGKTMLAAKEGLKIPFERHSPWIRMNSDSAIPLVYAIDSSKLTLAMANKLFPGGVT